VDKDIKMEISGKMPLITFFGNMQEGKDEKERIWTGRGKKPWFKRSEMHGDLPSNFRKV